MNPPTPSPGIATASLAAVHSPNSELSSAALVEAIAVRVVELLRTDSPLLDAADVARRLGRSRAWVYRNADELGAVRLGEGERPRLGFPPAKVGAFLDACSSSMRTERSAERSAEPRRRRRPAAGNGQGADLLPIRGEEPG